MPKNVTISLPYTPEGGEETTVSVSIPRNKLTFGPQGQLTGGDEDYILDTARQVYEARNKAPILDTTPPLVKNPFATNLRRSTADEEKPQVSGFAGHAAEIGKNFLSALNPVNIFMSQARGAGQQFVDPEQTAESMNLPIPRTVDEAIGGYALPAIVSGGIASSPALRGGVVGALRNTAREAVIPQGRRYGLPVTAAEAGAATGAFIGRAVGHPEAGAIIGGAIPLAKSAVEGFKQGAAGKPFFDKSIIGTQVKQTGQPSPALSASAQAAPTAANVPTPTPTPAPVNVPSPVAGATAPAAPNIPITTPPAARPMPAPLSAEDMMQRVRPTAGAVEPTEPPIPQAERDRLIQAYRSYNKAKEKSGVQPQTTLPKKNVQPPAPIVALTPADTVTSAPTTIPPPVPEPIKPPTEIPIRVSEESPVEKKPIEVKPPRTISSLPEQAKKLYEVSDINEETWTKIKESAESNPELKKQLDKVYAASGPDAQLPEIEKLIKILPKDIKKEIPSSAEKETKPNVIPREPSNEVDVPKVLGFLYRRKGATAAEIQEQFGIPGDVLRARLGVLEEDGQVYRKEGKWYEGKAPGERKLVKVEAPKKKDTQSSSSVSAEEMMKKVKPKVNPPNEPVQSKETKTETIKAEKAKPTESESPKQPEYDVSREEIAKIAESTGRKFLDIEKEHKAQGKSVEPFKKSKYGLELAEKRKTEKAGGLERPKDWDKGPADKYFNFNVSKKAGEEPYTSWNEDIPLPERLSDAQLAKAQEIINASNKATPGGFAGIQDRLDNVKRAQGKFGTAEGRKRDIHELLHSVNPLKAKQILEAE